MTINKKDIYVSNKKLNLTNWLPSFPRKTLPIQTNSWFQIEKILKDNSKTMNKYETTAPIIPPESLKEQQKSINQLKKRNSNLNKKPGFIYTKKIRIYPTIEQNKILHQWFNLFIKMYNITINFIRGKIYVNSKLISSKKMNRILNFRKIRAFLKKEKNKLIDSLSINKIKAHMLDEAIHLCVSNHKTCLSNLKAGHIKKFRVRAWSNKRSRKILIIEKGYFRNNTLCKSIFGQINSSEPFDQIDRTVTLQYNKNTHKYILLVPSILEEKIIIKNHLNAGVDLGVRSFATTYSSDHILNICENAFSNADIKKCHKKIDKINQIMSYSNPNQIIKVMKNSNHGTINLIKIKRVNKNKLKKAQNKYYTKIQNKVKDMHYKVAHKLVNSYDNIYIGKFNTRKILSKNNQKINSKTKRMISVLQPYKFGQVLKYMGYKYATNVIPTDEFLTTKTCSNCGKINEIGASKIYKCKCGLKTGRDENAAKNILKVGLKDNPLKK